MDCSNTRDEGAASASRLSNWVIGCRAMLFPAALVALGFPLVGLAAVPAPVETTDVMRADAALNDIAFVDAKMGWAVGDRGVIWHTEDGGENWRIQESNVTCSLASVCFANRERGWIAGGFTHPFTHLSQGVLLETRDGGRNWSLRKGLAMPALRRLKFFDSRQGIAFGTPSSLFPSGLFRTEDGGQSWEPIPARLGLAWQAGDFIDPLTGALAARSGPTAIVRRRSIDTADAPSLGLRSIRAMRLIEPSYGFAVGDGGLTLTSRDLGKTWQTLDFSLPEQAQQWIDFHALEIKGGSIWMAGSPGAVIFRSDDGGKTFHASRTGVRVPLRAITMVDRQRGFAVGDLGVILSTVDGGETWVKQRQGGERSAWLAILAEPDALPLEVVARYSGSEGYLGTATFLVRRDLSPHGAEPASLPRRAHEAMVQVGGCRAETAWQFPLREAGVTMKAETLMRELNRASDGRAVERMEKHLVKQIRMWRPEIVLTHRADASDALTHLINQVVQSAAIKAADATQYVDLSASVGLDAWKTKKIFGLMPAGQSGALEMGTLKMETTTLDIRLGRSPTEYALNARGLLHAAPDGAPTTIAFQPLVGQVAEPSRRADLFGGISLAPSGGARRKLYTPRQTTFEQLRRAAQKRRNMQRVIDHPENLVGNSEAMLGQLADVTAGLDASAGSRLLDTLARRYWKQGKWQMAAETFELMTVRYPDAPLARSAQIWLLQYYASSEAAWHEARQTIHVNQQVTALVSQRPTPGSDEQGVVPADSPARFHVSGKTKHAPNVARQERRRLEKATQLGKALEKSRPLLFAEPRLRFPLAVAQRKLGFTGDADRWLLALRQTRSDDAWKMAAMGERWLGTRNGPSPKATVYARSAPQRPNLDGRLEEAFWLQAENVSLTSDSDDAEPWRTTAKLAYDREFLYLAVTCRAANRESKRLKIPEQTRDADLHRVDRVDLLLDIDRDFATYYQLSFDRHGRAAENCWGDVSWNPTWYVATSSSGGQWTAEVAIPLAELTGTPPTKGHVWLTGIQRCVPDHTFVSWSRPAAIRIQPEGFGFLVFR